MVTKLWKNYNAKYAYDGYFTENNKLRKHATIISGILERYGKKKLQEIEKNCQSTISARVSLPDRFPPTIISETAVIAIDNSYVEVSVTEGLYGSYEVTNPVEPNDFVIILSWIWSMTISMIMPLIL